MTIQKRFIVTVVAGILIIGSVAFAESNERLSFSLPKTEVHIEPSGKVLIRGAVITSISGNEIKAISNINNGMVLKWTILSDSAEYIHGSGKNRVNITSGLVQGDTISFSGKLEYRVYAMGAPVGTPEMPIMMPSEDSILVRAQTIKNWSTLLGQNISDNKLIVLGTVKDVMTGDPGPNSSATTTSSITRFSLVNSQITTNVSVLSHSRVNGFPLKIGSIVEVVGVPDGISGLFSASFASSSQQASTLPPLTPGIIADLVTVLSSPDVGYIQIVETPKLYTGAIFRAMTSSVPPSYFTVMHNNNILLMRTLDGRSSTEILDRNRRKLQSMSEFKKGDEIRASAAFTGSAGVTAYVVRNLNIPR